MMMQVTCVVVLRSRIPMKLRNNTEPTNFQIKMFKAVSVNALTPSIFLTFQRARRQYLTTDTGGTRSPQTPHSSPKWTYSTANSWKGRPEARRRPGYLETAAMSAHGMLFHAARWRRNQHRRRDGIQESPQRLQGRLRPLQQTLMASCNSSTSVPEYATLLSLMLTVS